MATAWKVLKTLLWIAATAGLLARAAAFVGLVVLEGFDWLIGVGLLAIVLALFIGHVEKRLSEHDELNNRLHALHGYIAAVAGHPPPSGDGTPTSEQDAGESPP